MFAIAVAVTMVFPLATVSAADPTASESPDPKSSLEGSGPTGSEAGVLAGQLSQTIANPTGPLTSVTITDDLNCEVHHIEDPLHGEFYGETACATLVSVDGTLYGPANIPAGGAASPRTAFTPVSQEIYGDGSSSSPRTIKTVVDLGSTGVRLTQWDLYMYGAEAYETYIDLANPPTADRQVIVYRAGDCYLQNSDEGFGRSTAPGSVACVAAQFDGQGNPSAGSRIEEWRALTGTASYYEASYSEVWAKIGSQQAFLNVSRDADYIDNGAGLSWSEEVMAGETGRYDSRFTVSPTLATSQECASEDLSDTIGIDSTSQQGVTRRVDVTYDAEFLWPTGEADFAAKSAVIAQTVKDRADRTLDEYARLGFDVPATWHVRIECQPSILGFFPSDRDGNTDVDATRLRASRIASDFGDGQIVQSRPWAHLLDHELYHAVQINQIGAADLTLRQILQGDWTITESSAVLAEDLIFDHDDAADPGIAHSYLSLVDAWMQGPSSIDVDSFDGRTEYGAGPFIQYLGERFGDQADPDLEHRVAQFLKGLGDNGFVRDSAMWKAITGGEVDLSHLDRSDVYDALRDFYIAAYVHDAAAINAQTRIADQFTRHHEPPGSVDPVYYRRMEPAVIRNLGADQLVFQSPGDLPTLDKGTGRAYEINLPNHPDQVALTIRQTGGFASALHVAVLTVDSNGDIEIAPRGLTRTEAPFDPAKPFVVNTSGVTKLTVLVVAGKSRAEYVVTADGLGAPGSISLIRPSTTLPLTVSASAGPLSVPIWIRPSFDGGTTMAAGLPKTAFVAWIDGNPADISFLVENDDNYRLSLAAGALGVGTHSVTVTFDTVTTPPAEFEVINDGGSRQISAADDLGTLGQDETASATATISAATASAEFNLVWQGSDFDLVLTSPTGRVITEATQAADVIVTQGPASVQIAIQSPEAGTWQITGTGAIVPSPEPVAYEVTERDSAVLSSVELGGLDAAGTPIRIRGTVTDLGVGVVDATAVAAVTDPIGVTRHFALVDDGGHSDGADADGIYGAVAWATDAAGAYSIAVTFSGLDAAGRPFERVATADVALAPKADTDGDGLADDIEAWFGLDPFNSADAAVDLDGDGTLLSSELSQGLSPYSADTDGGGEVDSSEIARGLDPRDATDDAALPGVILSVEPVDGSSMSIGVATKDLSGVVHLERVDAGGRVDLGDHPGTGSSISDGPLSAGMYAYEAFVVAPNGARSEAIRVGPYPALTDATRPYTNVRLNEGNRWTNDPTIGVLFTDVSEPAAEMRLASSEEALETAPWVPYRASTTFVTDGAPGFHTVVAQVKDASGLESDPASGGVMIDLVEPASSIGNLPSYTNATTASLPFSASDVDAGVKGVEIWQRFRSSPTGQWTAWSLAGSATTSPMVIPLGNGDGDYEFYSVAVDRAGNREAPPPAADAALTRDGGAPESQVNALPVSVSDDLQVPFTASDDRSGIESVELWWRYRATPTGPWDAWTLGPIAPASPVLFTFPDGPGDYEFYTIGIDVAGNREAAPTAADASTERTGLSPWGQIIQVNDDTTTTSQVYPDVAIGPSGAAIAVWQDYRASPPSSLFSQYDIYASRWDPATETWSANARVNDVATSGQYAPEVAVDTTNNAYAVWVDARNGRTDIYFSKRSAATGVWSANVRVNSATNFNSQADPAIAVSPNGDAIALWYRKANNKLNLWSARLPAGGTTWGPEIRVTSNQTNVKQGPSVTFGADGTAYAAWMDPAANNTDIWFASLPPGSSTWSTNTKISDDPGTAYQGQPDIGVDGAGNVLVVWTDQRANPYELRVRRRPAGGAWLPSTVIAADGGLVPSLAVRADGRAYVAWQDGYCYLEYPGVWGAAYDPASTTWSAPERIDTNGAELCATSPSTALDADRTIVLWSNSLNLASGENDDDVVSRVKSP